LSGVNTGSDVPDGGGAAGPVWATASYSHAPDTTAASAIDTNDLMAFILSYRGRNCALSAFQGKSCVGEKNRKPNAEPCSG
jgi:hypothetical protein